MDEGDAQLGIPAIAGDPGPYAGATISVHVRPEPCPCLISIENDLGGWYQIAFRSDRPLSAESVQVKRSGTFREPFAEFGRGARKPIRSDPLAPSRASAC